MEKQVKEGADLNAKVAGYIFDALMRFDGSDVPKKRLSYLITSTTMLRNTPLDPTPLTVTWPLTRETKRLTSYNEYTAFLDNLLDYLLELSSAIEHGVDVSTELEAAKILLLSIVSKHFSAAGEAASVE